MAFARWRRHDCDDKDTRTRAIDKNAVAAGVYVTDGSDVVGENGVRDTTGVIGKNGVIDMNALFTLSLALQSVSSAADPEGQTRCQAKRRSPPRSTAGPGNDRPSISLPLASARQGQPPASAGYKLIRARAAEPPEWVTPDSPVSSRTAVAPRSTAGPGAVGRSSDRCRQGDGQDRRPHRPEQPKEPEHCWAV